MSYIYIYEYTSNFTLVFIAAKIHKIIETLHSGNFGTVFSYTFLGINILYK